MFFWWSCFHFFPFLYVETSVEPLINEFVSLYRIGCVHRPAADLLNVLFFMQNSMRRTMMDSQQSTGKSNTRLSCQTETYPVDLKCIYSPFTSNMVYKAERRRLLLRVFFPRKHSVFPNRPKPQYVYIRDRRDLEVDGRKIWVILARSSPEMACPEKSGVLRVKDYKQSLALESDGGCGTKGDTCWGNITAVTQFRDRIHWRIRSSGRLEMKHLFYGEFPIKKKRLISYNND